MARSRAERNKDACVVLPFDLVGRERDAVWGEVTRMSAVHVAGARTLPGARNFFSRRVPTESLSSLVG